jgi:hypothetical protein
MELASADRIHQGKNRSGRSNAQPGSRMTATEKPGDLRIWRSANRMQRGIVEFVQSSVSTLAI